jgi:hypothetical protein
MAKRHAVDEKRFEKQHRIQQNLKAVKDEVKYKQDEIN